MRHTSERVPGKNYRPFVGRPLYHHIIETLLDCALIGRVAIDTDSDLIMEDAAKRFPQVELIRRPDHLRDGTIPMNEILLHDVSRIDADLYLQTHSTNPLLKSESITRALEQYISRREEHDSAFSVTRVQSRFWDANHRPLNHEPNKLLRTQDLPPIFEENSCFFLFTKGLLERRRNRIGATPMLFEIDALEAWDIDEELDFEVAEFLCRRHRTLHKELQ